MRSILVLVCVSALSGCAGMKGLFAKENLQQWTVTASLSGSPAAISGVKLPNIPLPKGLSPELLASPMLTSFLAGQHNIHGCVLSPSTSVSGDTTTVTADVACPGNIHEVVTLVFAPAS